MPKFNSSVKSENNTPDATNLTGTPAFSRNDRKKELVSIILNSLLNGNSYYETEKSRLNNIENFLKDNDKEFNLFAAKAMVYVRTEGNLRSISHYMAGMLVENVKGSLFLKPAIDKILIRPDDATEIVALWNSRNTKSIPNSLRKAIKSSLENKWSAYQLKKYFGNSKVKVSNLVNICHPSPKDENQKIMFKQVLENSLPNIKTAQTLNASSTGEERSQNYAAILKDKKLGYMALLKNLKNMLEVSISDETIDNICDLLRNKNAVTKSRVLPFRFTQAYSIVDDMSIDIFKSKKILKAIEDGFILSAGNIGIAETHEKVAILLDESGSMGGWGENGTKDPFSIGKALMASMLTGLKKENTIGYLWADNSRRVNIDKSPMTFIKETTTKGGGTNLGQAIVELIKTKTIVDKIVIFTDMQENEIGNCDELSFNKIVKKYKKINPNVKFLFWNLEGYCTPTPIKLTHNVLEVNGFSDKMLSVIPQIWKNNNALIEKIEAINLNK